MAKLSALSTSSKVNIEMGGYTYSCSWLGYNHYGKSEVTLAIMDFIPVFSTTAKPKGTSSYFGGLVDNSLHYGVPLMMSSVLRNSLVEVSIYDGAKTANRSVFLPSPTECGQARVSVHGAGSGNGYFNYTATGSLFSTLPTLLSDNSWGSTTFGKFPMRGFLNCTAKLYYANTDTNGYQPANLLPVYCTFPFLYYSRSTASTNIPWWIPESSIGPKTQIISWGNSFSETGPSSTTNPTSMGVSATNIPCALMCLDGNCEVTGSGTNWSLSKGGAVETYRKLDGVWYRTI